MSGRGGKALSGEDRLLWEEVSRSVTPLKKRAKAHPPVVTGKIGAPEPDQPPRKTVRRIELPAYQAQVHQPATKTVKQIDDKTARRLGKARLDIDGRIDLHGMTERVAHARLLRFLDRARHQDWKIILVITGKGSVSGGILRQAVPRWLHEPTFAAMVSGYRPAHRNHGGEGALYVRMRRTGERGNKPR